MKKEVRRVNGKKQYLLGIRDNCRYWLQEAQWDCGWYWGLGYIESYAGKGCSDKSWRGHTHFDSQFIIPCEFTDGYIGFFEGDTTLEKNEIWVLLELMKSAYLARNYSDMLYVGGAHYTENPCKDIIKNEAEYKRINEEVIPAIMKKVYELLTPEEDK